jgi:hypothetical protein
VLEAARRTLSAERLGYTDALGLAALRGRIARHYGETYGIDVDRSPPRGRSPGGRTSARTRPAPAQWCYRHVSSSSSPPEGIRSIASVGDSLLLATATDQFNHQT